MEKSESVRSCTSHRNRNATGFQRENETHATIQEPQCYRPHICVHSLHTKHKRKNSQLHPFENFVVVVDLKRQTEIELHACTLGVHFAFDDGRVGRVDYDKRKLDLEVASLAKSLRLVLFGGFGRCVILVLAIGGAFGGGLLLFRLLVVLHQVGKADILDQELLKPLLLLPDILQPHPTLALQNVQIMRGGVGQTLPRDFLLVVLSMISIAISTLRAS